MHFIPIWKVWTNIYKIRVFLCVVIIQFTAPTNVRGLSINSHIRMGVNPINIKHDWCMVKHLKNPKNCFLTINSMNHFANCCFCYLCSYCDLNFLTLLTFPYTSSCDLKVIFLKSLICFKYMLPCFVYDSF